MRKSTKANTQMVAKLHNVRSTFNSARAGKKVARKVVHRDFPTGTYARGTQIGSQLLNQGHSHSAAVEVDHIPTDGSQRGSVGRQSKTNQEATLQRPAAPLLKSIHREHPTTAGGRRYDPGFAAIQRKVQLGYPHVGTVDQMRQRGREVATAMHIDAYEPIVKRLRPSATRRKLMAGAVAETLDRPTILRTDAGEVHHVSFEPEQRERLTVRAKRKFGVDD
ncbi:MAG: hypothetical protein HY308_02915 [Gammaproteobacteria bacterium]|nr:hypothetical protein [Gammaproteobacteria bacterium]